MSELKIEDVARICHEANRALCVTQGDNSQVSWDDAPEWQKKSAIDSVTFRSRNPSAPACWVHDDWAKCKIKDGWVYGETKDADKKTHPCLIPFDDLTLEQQGKDYLFSAIVDAIPTPSHRIR